MPLMKFLSSPSSVVLDYDLTKNYDFVIISKIPMDWFRLNSLRNFVLIKVK